MKKIILIGFAACYKSSVGKILSDKFNYNFVDTDEEIERICNMSVQHIFDTYGEAYFRQMESELLDKLNTDCFAKPINTVVACGGGAVLSSAFDEFAKDSTVICLTASADTVQSRFGKVSRPLFDGLTMDALNSHIQKRAPLYAKYAGITFTTDGKTSNQVAEQVYNWLNNHFSGD